MSSKFFALALLLPSLAFAASKPCLDGSCTFHVTNATTGVTTGSIFLNGSTSAISDLTEDAGWTVIGCDAQNNSHTVRAICTGSNSTCSHLYNNGANNTIVRLPAGCGKGPFARVVNEWQHENQTVPDHVQNVLTRRDGEPTSTVRGIIIDTNWNAVDPSHHGPVSMHVLATTGHDANATVNAAIASRQDQSLFDKLKEIAVDVTSPPNLTQESKRNWVDNLINGAASVAGKVVDVATSIGGDVATFVTSVAGDATSIGGDVATLVTSVAGDATSIGGDVATFVTSVAGDVTSIGGDVATFVTSVAGDATSAAGTFATAVTSVADEGASAVTSAAGTVATAVSSVIAKIKGPLAMNYTDEKTFSGSIVKQFASGFLPCAGNQYQPAFSVTYDITANATASGSLTYGIVASGSVIPPDVTQFTVEVGFNVDISSSIDWSGLGGFSTSSGLITLLDAPLTPLAIPDIISIGPAFQLNVKATQEVQAYADLSVDLGYTISGVRLSTSDGSSGGTFSPKKNHVSFYVAPGAVNTGTVSAHIIPTILVGVDVLAGKAQASVDVNLDASATLDLSLVKSAAGTFTGSAEIDGGLSVNAGATLGKTTKQYTIIGDSWKLWSRTFSGNTRRDHARELPVEKRASLPQGMSCQWPAVNSVKELVQSEIPVSALTKL